MRTFKKILIANRGEIAVRLARTFRDMEIASVAVYSDADSKSLHVSSADEAVAIGAAPALSSYLDIERLLDAARRTGADALHPGYGFLSESPELAEACERAGVVFVGPPISAMQRMARKVEAREAMRAAGVPVIPGGPANDLTEARQTALEIGYPVLLKPSAGGGGKGMRVVTSEAELPESWQRAKSEAQNAFGDDTVYLEKLLDRSRHIEVQLLGDQHGNVVHLYERDCSLQRRHQKIIEETPSSRLSPEAAAELGRVAVRGARSIGYFSAGTMEFLLTPNGEVYFLEMNTRLQVEHPVTELCTGVDLVELMVRVAQGGRLPFSEPPPRWGHALECRIYAEDPSRGFLPSPGTIESIYLPAGPGVRNDEGVRSGQHVSPEYDPLIAKLVIHGADRRQVLRRAERALSEYRVTGIATNLDFLRRVLESRVFSENLHDTRFLDENLGLLLASDVPLDSAHLAVLAALTHERNRAQTLRLATSPSPWVLQHRLAAGRGRPR